MEAFGINKYEDHSCDFDVELKIDDYKADQPRWCKGCGDFSILSAVQKILRDRQIEQHQVACISGIGCSSRFPYYLNAYGFHGIHGRALTISTGASIARPDMHVLTVMGDGDCFSIGAGHWLHALHKNAHMTVMVFDNEIYALTKKQVSPTTKQGTATNTTPRGAYLKALNPLSVMLGITNLSFLAQTATWLPGHLAKTLMRAWDHPGLSFVRILQKCPVFSGKAFTEDGTKHLPLVFLENENGIAIDNANLKYGNKIQHDQGNLSAAQHVAHRENNPPGTEIAGLIYYNENVPVYNDVRHNALQNVEPQDRLNKLNQVLDNFSI